jgi:tetratricopeptide (TPR) repeat protein
MTSSCTLGAPAPPRRRPSARALALVLLLANAATSGCGAHAPAHRGEPTERRATAKLSPREERILEAREQMALDPQEPYWPYRLAQIQLESDSLAAAEAALKASLRSDPSYAASLSLLSKLYYDAGRHAEAIALLEFARTRPGAFPDGVPQVILAGLALHYEALGRHDLAAAIMADAEKSRSGGARSAAAYLTLRGEAAGSAADRAAAALEENPKSAANQNNFGITKLRAGDPKAAREAFLRAIELDPKLPGPYYNLAILERYYLFDDAAAARWLAAYRARAGQDPDGLFGDIEKAEPKPVAKEGR